MQIKNLKSAYQNELKRLGESFLERHQSPLFLSKHTELVDRHLATIWSACGLDESLCLVAVGGYGRKELFPYSDIDFLVLFDEKLNGEVSEKISKFIAACWDLGLKIGHSVRSLDEVKEEFHKDITTATNLLENRLIIGEIYLFNKLILLIEKELAPKQFYAGKIAEQTSRHKRYRDSAYQLEPNIKESPGGLRDIQTVLWISSSQKKGRTLSELYKKNVIDKPEFNKITAHVNRTNKRRILLHLLSGSIQDRVSFDLQNQMAKNLGYPSKKNKKSSEILMKNYYKSVNYIILFNEILIKRLDPNKYPRTPIKHPLGFFKYNDLLEIPSEKTKALMTSLFDPFLLMQQDKEIVGFGPNLLGGLDSNAKLITSTVRKNKRYQQAFLDVLNADNKVNRALRLMNKTNVLGRFIPDFGKVVAQMQHDLFHIYTVDEHTLNVIENIRRFSKEKLKHEFPECFAIFKAFDKPYVLYLAAIFHDIAKGRGGDHSELGEKIARRFGRAYNLNREDSTIIAWLVKSHLTMSSTAQKMDLSDPEVINHFSNFVGNKRNLEALYLLTVADIRATSPHVWNEWKASLLHTLYKATTRNLTQRSLSKDEFIQDRKMAAAIILKKYSLASSDYQRLWDEFGKAYFLRFDDNEIAWQTRILLPHLTSNDSIVRVRHGSHSNGVEVMIYTKDTAALFSKITNFFYGLNLEITQAKVFTTKHGYALDVFSLMVPLASEGTYNNLFKKIETDLTATLLKELSLNKIKLKKTNQALHHDFVTEITFEKNKKGQYDLDIITDNKTGLLNLIANEINLFGFSIDDAKINTLGTRVEDFFVISSEEKHVALDKLNQLSESIKQKLSEND